MKRTLIALLLILPVAAVTAGGQSESGQTAGETATRSDEELKEAVTDQLFWDDRVDAAEITVSVDEGAVTLEGEVGSFSERDAAVETAWSVTGVEWVNDRLEITETASQSRDVFTRVNVETALELSEDVNVENITVQTTADGTVTLSGSVDSYWKKVRAEEIASGVKGVSVAINNIEVSTGESVTDQMVQADIASSLERNADVERGNVAIEVEDGEVTLSGTVDSWLSYTEAEEAARYTVGVEAVTNNLRIEPPARAEADRAEIRSDVRDQLEWDYRVDEDDVNVAVDDGVVTLSGTVESFSAKEAAAADAWSVTGVVEVVNNVEVDAEAPGSDAGNISRSVENVLEWNSEIDATDIRITTIGGIVTIEGTVESYWKKVRAEDLASGVSGVVDVQNRLAVVPTDDLVDERIAEDIVNAIERKSFVDMENITVRVEDGVVGLSGEVGSRTEHEAVYESGLYTDGVVAVNDENLTIENY
ncbi:MAG: BON domain-containing protein [Spirochaetes bacterium]|jgi:osmotically-inducible protein OsmY|nr:BON domain-containing protein [Spirochaetota bacterium]